MSDSMAFLAGAGCAGVAAILLLKGSANPDPFLVSNSPPPSPAGFQSAVTTAPLPPPPVFPSVPPCNTEQQLLDTERLKTQLEQQRNEIEQLKTQLQNQQLVIESVKGQLQANATSLQLDRTQALAPVPQTTSPIVSGMLWALGGTVLTIFVGIVLAAVFALLSQTPRSSRPVQVIHPLNAQPSYLPPRRRSEFLPPRIRGRRYDPPDEER